MGQGSVHSFKAATTLAAYRAVYVSAANTVAYVNTISSAIIGVSMNSIGDTVQSIPIQLDGIARIVCNDTFAAGALISADTAGKGVPYAAVTAPTSFIGVALEACAATGTVVQVVINPDFKSIP